jgi:hypothetical protein
MSGDLLCASAYVPIADFSAENLAQSWAYFRDACLMVEELFAAQFGGISVPELARTGTDVTRLPKKKKGRLH